MADYFATTVNYDGTVIGLVYLQSDDHLCFFAMSSGRDGLIRALIDCSYMFDEELLDNCISEVQELEIPTLPSNYSSLFGTWAYNAYGAFMRVLSETQSNEFMDRTKDLVETICTFQSTDVSGIFLLYSKDSKVMQLFSKQQTDLIWPDLPGEVSNEDRLKLHRQIRQSPLRTEDETQPCIWERDHASLMTTVFLMNGLMQIQKTEEVLSYDRPWKDNYKLN